MGFIGNQSDGGVTYTNLNTVLGILTDAAELGAVTGMVSGDAYKLADTGHIHMYSGTAWIDLGAITGPIGLTGSVGATGPAGIDGAPGTIDHITRTAGTGAEGTTDTYTAYADVGETQLLGTFDVYNGTNGVDGQYIDHTSKTAGTGASGTTDTYTVWGNVGETVEIGTFSVYNGVNGAGTVASIVAGTNVTVDATDPKNPVINVGNTLPDQTANGGKYLTTDGTVASWGEVVGSEHYDQEAEPTVNSTGATWYVPSTEVLYKRVNDGVSDAWLAIANAVDNIVSSPISKPSITSPLDNAIDTDIAITIVASTYATSELYNGAKDTEILEIASDSGFTNIVYTGGLTASGLSASTQYYARVRYGSDGHLSEYSDTVSFTTRDAGISDPTITSPTDGAVDTDKAIVVMSSVYNAFGHSEGHSSSSWQIATDTGFTNIVEQSLLDAVNLTSYTASGLDDNTQYYVRVKYSSTTYESGYSVAIGFTTKAVGINDPIVTSPTNGETEVGKNAAVVASAYSVFGGLAETHVSTDWQVASDSGFITIVSESPIDTSNLTSWTSGDLTESTTYYIRARYNSASYTSGWSMAVSFTTAASFGAVYGLNWNQTNDTYVRTGDATGWTPFTQFDTGPGNVEGTKGTQGLDDFSTNETVQKYMRRCVLNTNGTVNYYLDANDSTLKEDGVTASVLNGTDGNVMVEIPKFYYKYNYNTTTGVVHEHTVSLVPFDGAVVHPAFVQAGVEKDYRYAPAYQGSIIGGKLMSVSGNYVDCSQTRDQFRTAAEANGAGWHVYDWLLYEAATLLMVIEYGSLNLQAAFGEGRTCLTGGTWADSSYYGIHGNSNSDGNFSNNNQEGAHAGARVDADNAPADLVYMTYRGIENFWGTVWLFLDGINLFENIPYINDNPATFADDVESGDYVSAGITMTASDGYSSELANSNKGFFPTAVAGSNSTHTGDYFYANDAGEHGVVLVSAPANCGLDDGPLFLRGDLVASDSLAYCGAAVSY